MVLKFFSKTLKVPTVLVTKAGLPEELKGKEIKIFAVWFKTLEKASDISIYQILENYYELLNKSPSVLASLGHSYKNRSELYNKARKFFITADEALKLKDLALASESYAEGLESYPYLYSARLNLGFCLRELKQYEQAIKCYLDGLKFCTNDLLLHTNLGRTYLEKGDADLALEQFKEAYKIYPNDQFTIDVLEKMGEFVRILKDPNDQNSAVLITREQWNETLVKQIEHLKSPDEFIKYFYGLVGEGNKDQFIKLWPAFQDKVLIGNPKNEAWYLLSGFFYRMTREDQKAADVWQKGLQEFPNSVPILSNLGKVQKGHQRIQTYERAFELGDQMPDGKFLYFAAFKELHGEKSAIDRMIELYKKTSDFGFVEVSAIEQFEEGSDKFISYLQKYLDFSPEAKRINIVANLSAILGQKQNFKAVIQLTTPLVNADVKDLMIHWNWASAQMMIGKKDLAITHFQKLSNNSWMSQDDKEKIRLHLEKISK